MKRTLLRNLTLVFGLIIFTSGCTFRNNMIRIAHGNIVTIKEGGLLVRLNSSENKIKKLLELGKAELAEEARLADVQDRQNTIEAFQQEFNFTNVYFFEANQTTLIKNGEFANLKLFDVNMDVVEDVEFLNQGFLVGAFDRVFQTIVVKDAGKTSKRIENVATAKRGLVIMDSNFQQLLYPFPYRVITSNTGDKEIRAVNRMNYLLHEWYGYYIKDRQYEHLRPAKIEEIWPN